MRIGDLNSLNKPKISDNQETTGYPPVFPELSQKQKKRQRIKNWWYYYKWYVVCGIIVLGIIINVSGSYLGLWTKAPNIQIAYIGKTELPPDTVSALEQAFSYLASDFNKDGKVIVQINQYISGLQSTDPDMAYYEYASEISLLGDISDCESYFFLMDDPTQFQRNYQLLASPDGSCPEDTDYSVEDKVILWTDCPVLVEMDLGTYTASILGKQSSGNNQELLSGLFIGRRCFFTDDITKHADQCSKLWDMLYENSR